MKKTKNIILSVALAIVFVLTSVLVLWQVGDNNGSFKGIYGEMFSAFAEENTADEMGETKYMKSVDGKYILLATALHIQNTDNYTEIGYYVAKNNASVNDDALSSNAYYTGITVKTGADTTKTWTMQDIFVGDENVMGMIVVEMDYSESNSYQIQPYAKAIDESVIVGTTYSISYKYTLSLNLMSFNIRTATSNDTGATNWSARRDAVSEFINTSGADVIGLQEVKISQFDYINGKLPEKYTGINFPRQSGSDAEGLSIIYNSDKFSVVSTEKYWLSETPEEMSYGWGEEYYRICVVVVLEHKQTGEQIKVINTHGPLNATARENGYNLIMERSVTDDMFTYLCGDFNAKTTDPAYSAVANELQDTRFTAMHSPNRNHNTFTGWGGTDEGSSIIDYCFVSNGDNVHVLSYEVCLDKYEWTDGNMHRISDHYATQCIVNYEYFLDASTKLPDVNDGGFDGDLDSAN